MPGTLVFHHRFHRLLFLQICKKGKMLLHIFPYSCQHQLILVTLLILAARQVSAQRRFSHRLIRLLHQFLGLTGGMIPKRHIPSAGQIPRQADRRRPEYCPDNSVHLPHKHPLLHRDVPSLPPPYGKQFRPLHAPPPYGKQFRPLRRPPPNRPVRLPHGGQSRPTPDIRVYEMPRPFMLSGPLPLPEPY